MSAKKKVIIQSVICIILTITILGLYKVGTNRLDERIKLCKDDYSWMYQIDSVEIKGRRFVMNGFAFQLNKDAKKGSYEIVLHNISTNENVFLEMSYSERKDVNDYFLCENNYLFSGFEADIKEKELDLQNQVYEVLLRVKGEKIAYQTGVYLQDGQLLYANPKEFVQPEVKGTALEKIVENGVLRVYRPDYGVYLYQYSDQLFWIVKRDYPFDENNNATVECHLDTTQYERLPSNRLANGHNFDNIGFNFSDYEVNYEGISNYRVAKISLPRAYSITKILTGLYRGEWVWNQSFRPYYFAW